MSERLTEEQVSKEKDPNVIKVFVGLPHEGMTGCEAYTSRLSNFKHLGHLEERMKLEKASPRFEFYQVVIGRMHVHVAREEMAKKALFAGADYLLMIDDDMTCPDDMFEKLYATGKDIVAPLAFTRNFPHKPVAYRCVDGWDPVSNCDTFTNFSIMNYPKDKLFQVDAVGFGAVLINMDVIRKMPSPWFMNPYKTGEDIYFCYEAKKYGFTTWMDSRVKLGHVSHPIVVTEEYVEQQWKAHDMQVPRMHGEYKKYQGNGNDAKEPILVLGE